MIPHLSPWIWVAALILLFLAAVALVGFLYLLITDRESGHQAIKTEACDLELHDRCMKDWCSCTCHVEPPPWQNHGTARRPCYRPTPTRRLARGLQPVTGRLSWLRWWRPWPLAAVGRNQ